MFSLKNKITLVTGAGSGIGASIAETFAEEGAHVYVADRDARTGGETVERIKAARASAEFLQLDVSSEADCERASQAAQSSFGRLDVLVNNAGIGHVGTMLQTTGADMDRRVLEDVFPVLDTLALAITAAKQPKADLKSLVGGVDMVLAQLKSALASHGLKEISPAGQPFDPHQHEAISHQPSKDVKEEHVLTVVRTGYSLNGRLLRPASVVISSGPAKEGNKS